MNFDSYKRIVIKIGSSIITDKDGTIKTSWLESVGQDVNALLEEGKDIIIVTSGGVSLGRKHIKKPSGALRLEEKQAAFACGQTDLMQGYKECFKTRSVAQILLTIRDTEKRRNYLNAKNAMETMMKSGIIPVINENDVVATTELSYGDNDRLSARVAEMMSADLLIILSDVDGLYDKSPSLDSNAKIIKEVTEITEEIEQMAGGSDSTAGSGGMHTKVEAAKIAVGAGCACVITSGKNNNPLKALRNKEQNYTIFHSKVNPHTARKSWIVAGVHPMGEIFVDAGAEKALLGGSSLLPIGATKVKGEFERGDLVVIEGPNGEIARGLTAYSSENAKKIIGKQSSEIEEIVGYSGRDELMHRDDMVITAQA